MSVYCLLALEEIPESVCETEQRPRACEGCTAKSRRCVGCHEPGHIMFPKQGFCADCGLKHGLGNVESGEVPAERLDAQIRKVQGFSKKRFGVRPETPREDGPAQIKPMDVAKRPERLISILEPFATKDPSGIWRVKQPRRILMMQASLLPTEADEALVGMVERGLVEAAPPWTELRLRNPPAKKEAWREDEEDEEPPGPIAVPVETAAPATSDKAGQAYEQLAKAAKSKGGKRLVTGALPLLEKELSMDRMDAIMLLQELMNLGRLTPVGGWTTVELAKE